MSPNMSQPVRAGWDGQHSGDAVDSYFSEGGPVASYYTRAKKNKADQKAERRTWVAHPREEVVAAFDNSGRIGGAGRYTFVSGDQPELEGAAPELPAMSLDGGSEEEFQEYWHWNSLNTRMREDWFERMAHPQVNCEAFWYHPESGITTYDCPATSSVQVSPADLTLDIPREGPVWNFTAFELKSILREGHGEDFGLAAEALAQRACYEFETWLPRVLSWHDYQYRCFWFFGGKDTGKDSKESKSFFGSDAEASRQLFADDDFFEACTRLLCQRMGRMHPINLTYFMWTYARAGIRHEELLKSVADHFCKGWLPTMDRCSLGTMVWNFSKLEFRHDRYFELSAQELYRPNRLRSLAPRNFQNSMIAYSKRKHWNAKLMEAFCRGIPRLLDNHDPKLPKTSTEVLFSYTCRDGSEVPADAFRIGSLTVIAKAFHDLRARGAAVQECLKSMLDYVVRSVQRSPQMMREPGDACSFLRQLGFYAAESGMDLSGWQLELQDARKGAPERAVGQMEAALRKAGVEV
ncbi:unnamed protein product [Effrenium voratum]|uniref:Uncharacterized protein n=1 Tax=Effrenium voratum TaxID=2562239 RepID=A0AA36J210_9DINO|nr:unnamed protein product [Effrenium voratum]